MPTGSRRSPGRYKNLELDIGGSVCVDSVVIVVDYYRGHMVMFEAGHSGYRELGRMERVVPMHPAVPPGKVHNKYAFIAPLVVVDGKLMVRGPGGMACVDLK